MNTYKTLMIRYLYCLLYCSLLICTHALFGQNSILKNSKAQTKYYQAKINDINDLAVTLTFSGTKCSGLAQYVRSKEVFRLEGTLQNETIRLTETDRAGAISGFWYGALKNNGFNITWLNHDNTLGNTITLTETTRQLTEPTDCAANKWIHRYEGFIGFDNLELIVQRVQKNQLVGIAYFNKEALTVKGEILEDAVWEMTLLDAKGNEFGKLRGSKPTQNEWRMVLNKPNNAVRYSAMLQLKDNISVNCIEYADYFISYDAIFPVLESAEKINTSWQQPIEQWLRECRAETEKLKLKYAHPTPPDRCAARGSAWCEIEWWDTAIWSARFTANQTWASAATTPININLLKDEEITLAQIFKDEAAMRVLLRKNVINALKTTWKTKDKAARNWILLQDFSKIFNIRKGGLTFSTPFHATYGQHQIEISYTQLKSLLKKDSPIVYLTK
jgi:hypothetical protein